MAAVRVPNVNDGLDARVYDVTMSAGASSEVITHGLVYTPTVVTITPNGVSAAGCYASAIRVGAIVPFVAGPPAVGGTVEIMKIGGGPGVAASARVVISRAYTDQT